MSFDQDVRRFDCRNSKSNHAGAQGNSNSRLTLEFKVITRSDQVAVVGAGPALTPPPPPPRHFFMGSFPPTPPVPLFPFFFCRPPPPPPPIGNHDISEVYLPFISGPAARRQCLWRSCTTPRYEQYRIYYSYNNSLPSPTHVFAPIL